MFNHRALDALLQERTAADQFSGVVLIKRGDEVVCAQAYGYASRAWRVENSLAMRFQVASVTKMFTAVSVLQLVDRGTLTLSDCVVDVLGLEGTAISSEVTIEHVLKHRSGIGDYYEESEIEDHDAYAQLWLDRPNYTVRTHEDMLPLFLNAPPNFRPGERFLYNNAGFILLGRVIETLSAMSYTEYVRRHVFQPAKMNRSDFIPLDSVSDCVAECHLPVVDDNGLNVGWKKGIYAVPVMGMADGGAYATADDLVRFMRALRTGRLLSEEMTEAMLTPVDVSEDAEDLWHVGYGLFFLSNKKSNLLRYGHTGEDPGVSARVLFYRERDLDVVMLGNQSGCVGEVVDDVHRLILEGF